MRLVDGRPIAGAGKAVRGKSRFLAGVRWSEFLAVRRKWDALIGSVDAGSSADAVYQGLRSQGGGEPSADCANPPFNLTEDWTISGDGRLEMAKSSERSSASSHWPSQPTKPSTSSPSEMLTDS